MEGNTNKRKRTTPDETDLVVIGITCFSMSGNICSTNETVLASLEDACSFTFKDGTTIPPSKIGNDFVFTKMIDLYDMRPFILHCRGGVAINDPDHEKQPPFPHLFINYYNSRQYRHDRPKRKEITPLKGRVIGFINLFADIKSGTGAGLNEVEL